MLTKSIFKYFIKKKTTFSSISLQLWWDMMHTFRIHRFVLIFLVGLSFSLVLNLTIPAIAQSVSTSSEQASINLNLTSSSLEKALANGTTYYQEGQYARAIATWQQALKLIVKDEDKAVLHSHLGNVYRQVGQMGDAIKQWEEAAKIYQGSKDKENLQQLAKVIADLAQAYNALGQFQSGIKLSKQAIDVAKQSLDQETEAIAYGVLGNAYSIAGEYEQALNSYAASFKLANSLNNPIYVTTALNNQVNVLNARYKLYQLQSTSAQQEGNEEEEARFSQLAQQDRRAALAAASLALQRSRGSDSIPEVRALISTIQVEQQKQQSRQDLIDEYREKAYSILSRLPDSRSKVYALINLTQTKGLDSRFKIQILEKAALSAKHLGDRRAESFALGQLGHAHELARQYDQALKLTQEAQFAAQQVNAVDSLYRWQSQAGRINKNLGKDNEAISSYKHAIATLQAFRSDIIAARQDLQFDVRDEAEPVYRQLMELLLKEPHNPAKLEEVLEVYNNLKLSELQDFFGDECLENRRDIATFRGNQTAANEALIYSIILDKETWMVLRLPDGRMQAYPVALTAEQIQREIEALRYSLANISTESYLSLSKKIYSLLLRPLAADLDQAKIDTLIFVNDGVLRNVPMAALHDGNQFLIQKYAIASTLGFNLSSPEKQQDYEALTFGLSVAIPPFDALPKVEDETAAVQEIVGGKRFLNEAFTLSNFKKQAQKYYPVVHIATHGEFGGSADRTFIQAFDRRISLAELEQLLKTTNKDIDLLTLSACQTAAGDNRSTLGISTLR